MANSPNEYHKAIILPFCNGFNNKLHSFLNKQKMSVTQQPPQYVCHKVVGALQIKSIAYDKDLASETNRETDGSAMITPTEEGYSPFKVDAALLNKHKPEEGGYIVYYEDGYTSFSPKKAFEDGYRLIAEHKTGGELGSSGEMGTWQ